jgi:hypothetical protein
MTAEVIPSDATRSNQPMNLTVAFGARRLSAGRYATSDAIDARLFSRGRSRKADCGTSAADWVSNDTILSA